MSTNEPPSKRAKVTTSDTVIIDKDIVVLTPKLKEFRQHLHAHAELSFQEEQTSAYILSKLQAIDGVDDIVTGLGRAPVGFKGASPGNVPYTRLEQGTGITAYIRGTLGDGPCILIRADIDALPIVETAPDCEYASKNNGVMHACGHDGHVAMVLVAAEVLAARRNTFKGSVKVLFQPAEECGGGAQYMLEQLEDVDQVYGIHLMSSLLTGTIGVKDGPLMAATDRFLISIEGKGGHGAMPHLSVDAMLCAAQVSVALQTIVAREIDPLDAAVVSIGKMENEEGSTTCGCGSTFNVLCGKVVMHGTTRSFSSEVQMKVRESVERITVKVSEAMRAKASVKWDDVTCGWPATINSAAETAMVRAASVRVVGEAGVRTGKEIMTMGGEDFAYFLNNKPGCFIFVGATAAGAQATPHHHPSFNIDEDALAIGATLWLQLVATILGE